MFTQCMRHLLYRAYRLNILYFSLLVYYISICLIAAKKMIVNETSMPRNEHIYSVILLNKTINLISIIKIANQLVNTHVVAGNYIEI